MSLKAFHILFILASILLAFGFGGWGIYMYLAVRDASYLTMGALSFVFGAVLILYGLKFFRKLGTSEF